MLSNLELEDSYEKKWKDFLNSDGLNDEKLKASINLFNESDSFAPSHFVPVAVDLYALLAGLPFKENEIKFLEEIQYKIFKSLNNRLVYKVKNKNFGLECFVLKWHYENNFELKNLNIIKNYLKNLKLMKFNISFKGVQIHTDGCVIAKFIDENKEFRVLRKQFIDKFDFLPKKQSNWVHIPLGRILYPIEKIQFNELIYTCNDLKNKLDFEIEVDKYSLVKEERWYMEEKTILMVKDLL